MSPFTYAFAENDVPVYSQEATVSGSALDQWWADYSSNETSQSEMLVAESTSSESSDTESSWGRSELSDSQWWEDEDWWDGDEDPDSKWDTQDLSEDVSEWDTQEQDTTDSSVTISWWDTEDTAVDFDFSWKTVAWITKMLWGNWDTDSDAYAEALGIENYQWLPEQNEIIRKYMIENKTLPEKKENTQDSPVVVEWQWDTWEQSIQTSSESNSWQQRGAWSSYSSVSGWQTEENQQAKIDSNYTSVLDYLFHEGVVSSASSPFPGSGEDNLEQVLSWQAWNEENSSEQASQNDEWNISGWQEEEVDYTVYKTVAWLANKLWIDWDNESEDYAFMAWIERKDYMWTAEQNEQIKLYILYHIDDILSWRIKDMIAEANKAAEPLEAWELENQKLCGEWEECNKAEEVEELTWAALELYIAWQTLDDKEIKDSKTYDKVTVNVNAPANTFPQWTQLKITPVKWSELEDVKQQIVWENANVEEDSLVAFNIQFLFKLSDGTEIELQPRYNTVEVTFDYSRNRTLKNPDDQELEVYHINNKDEKWNIVEKWEEVVEKVDINVEKSDGVKNGLVVDAESFSIYAVIRSNLTDTITIIYDANGWRFKWWATTKTVTYTKDANNLYVASENVQAPNKSWKWMFDWWYTDTTYATEWYGVANDTTTTSKTVYARWLPFEDLPAVTASDGTKYILMDRNLWASDVWNYGESETSAVKNGRYYQWWNNYGFPASNGNGNPYPYTSNMSVDASWYWPGNYYSSATFILIDYRWDDADNANLWWWNWDTATADWPSTTEEGRQWPCPSWYHVPSTREWKAIYNALGVETYNSGSIATLQKTLHLPKAGARYNTVNTNVVNMGTEGNYWSSSPNIYSNLGPGHAPGLYFSSSYISSQSDNNCSQGRSVRCFKNSPIYTLTLVPNNWSGNITVDVYGDTVDEWDIPTVTKDGYTFAGWYLTWAESAFNFTETAITWDITLYAKWLADFV